MFRIFTTKEFDDDFSRLYGSDKQRIRKIMEQLKSQGGSVGKPLGLPYFKEKNLERKDCIFWFIISLWLF